MHDSIGEFNYIDRIKNSRSITLICTSISKYFSKLYFIIVFLKMGISETLSVLEGLKRTTIVIWHLVSNENK
jgi:hypothetical protein